MRSAIATWPRRAGVAGGALLLALGVSVLILVSSVDGTGALLSMGTLMKRLVLVPGLVAIMVFAFATVIAGPRAVAASSNEKAAPITGAGASRPFVAQVVGLGWMNPLQRKDYSTEWQILWTLGLVKPNVNDDMVRVNPKKIFNIATDFYRGRWSPGA